MPYPILVVDDTDSVRHWLRVALEPRDWTVHEASSAREALKQVEDVQPAVVVLDHMMPETTGLEVAATLRERGYAGTIVLFSAYLGAGMAAEVRRLDVTPISKVDHEALFRVLEVARPRD
ncbi:MAG TPA: response regulator [Acidimicrobiales bacterium]|nr:response regulator [Acidimicrobiales bacterium]